MAARRKPSGDLDEKITDKERDALEAIANYQWGHDGRSNALTRIIEDMQRIAKGAL